MNSAPPKIYGLIGHPVRHSFSPAMHNAAFKFLGINAEYRLFEVEPRRLRDFLFNDVAVEDSEGNRISTDDIWGFNVTVPHKERILDYISLESESSYLRQIKAINTIIKKDGIWKGFNTDIPGFARDLKEKIDPVDKSVAILGAGGAARAVVYVLANSRVRDIDIYDIDDARSHAVVGMVRNLFPECDIKSVDSIEQLNIRSKDILINATPVGLKNTDPCLVSYDMLHRGLFVYDLIYNPPETRLLSLAKRIGARVSNGLGMLLHQGVLSFIHFTNMIDSDRQIAEITKVMRLALQDELEGLRG